MACAGALQESLEGSYFCSQLYFPQLLSPSPSPLSITDALSLSISVSLRLHSAFPVSLSQIDEQNSSQGESGTEIPHTAWRKLLAPPTGINEKIKRIFSINKRPVLHVCVWWAGYQPLISSQWLADLFTLSWVVLLLAALCQDEGEDSWWGKWVWVCMGKRIVGWFCASVRLGVCVSHSRTHCRGNRPCFVRAGGEVGVWGCHSTYGCSNWKVQAFRPGSTARSPPCVLPHTHAHWYYLPAMQLLCQKASVWKIRPCCKGVCVPLCECTITPDCSGDFHQTYERAELEGLQHDEILFSLERWTVSSLEATLAALRSGKHQRGAKTGLNDWINCDQQSVLESFYSCSSLHFWLKCLDPARVCSHGASVWLFVSIHTHTPHIYLCSDISNTSQCCHDLREWEWWEDEFCCSLILHAIFLQLLGAQRAKQDRRI